MSNQNQEPTRQQLEHAIQAGRGVEQNHAWQANEAYRAANGLPGDHHGALVHQRELQGPAGSGKTALESERELEAGG